MQEMPNREELLDTGTTPEPQNPSPAPAKGSPNRTVQWVLIGLAAGALGMCVLCGGALLMMGLLANTAERNAHPAAVSSGMGGAMPDTYSMPQLSGGNGIGMPDSGMPASGYPYGGADLGAAPNLSDSDSSFSDYLRESDAERSWWSEEWSRALGDNYPEPTHVDPDGNSGWIDHSGAFHDYNSGMSDYEASTLSGSNE